MSAEKVATNILSLAKAGNFPGILLLAKEKNISKEDLSAALQEVSDSLEVALKKPEPLISLKNASEGSAAIGGGVAVSIASGGHIIPGLLAMSLISGLINTMGSQRNDMEQSLELIRDIQSSIGSSEG